MKRNKLSSLIGLYGVLVALSFAETGFANSCTKSRAIVNQWATGAEGSLVNAQKIQPVSDPTNRCKIYIQYGLAYLRAAMGTSDSSAAMTYIEYSYNFSKAARAVCSDTTAQSYLSSAESHTSYLRGALGRYFYNVSRGCK